VSLDVEGHVCVSVFGFRATGFPEMSAAKPRDRPKFAFSPSYPAAMLAVI